jgi:hypothetical protein
MASNDPRLVRLERLLRLYRGGVYTAAEVAAYCVAAADPAVAADLLRPLPPEVRQRVRQSVAEAPVAEGRWASLELFTIGYDPEPALSRDERVARYRTSVEAWRQVLAANSG